MKSRPDLYSPKPLILSLIVLLAAGILILKTGSSTDTTDQTGEPPQAIQTSAPEVATTSPKPAPATLPAASHGDDWMNNGGEFTEPTAELVEWLDAGKPLAIRIGDEEARYGFRPSGITTEDFRLSSGITREMPAEYRIYSGRQLLPDGSLGERASVAVVNGAVSMAVTRDGMEYLVETDPETGQLYATEVTSLYRSPACQDETHGEDHLFCALSEGGRLASVTAPDGAGMMEGERIPVDFDYPDLQAGDIANAETPPVESAQVSHPYFRRSPVYDASLRDMVVLHTSAKSQTGDSSLLSSRAASYFSYFAQTADIYERQLGLRYLIQELILVPSDSNDEDPGNPPDGVYSNSPDLEHYQVWLNKYRPQSTYKYGHAALWTLVDGSAGGVVGRAWLDSYGSSRYAQSVQERNWGWLVHSHELGHNVGSSHTSGGVMNPSLISGAEDFFTLVSGQTYTGAKDIFNYMGYASRAYVYGPASLRNPEEMPFGIDDAVSTATDTVVSFNPLANDRRQVTNGALNNLRLIEVGAVYPAAAGSAEIVNGQIQFTPTGGYTGQAWFTYTLAGDVGNNGNGWYHSADVVVTVGGDSSEPTQAPALKLAEDYIPSDFSGDIRFNPLLNDEGTGALWSGPIEAMVGPNDTTPEAYSEGAFHLVSARVLSGSGSLVLETQSLSRSGEAAYAYTGYMVYTPGSAESGSVIIEYTVMDANGNTSTGQVTIGSDSSGTPTDPDPIDPTPTDPPPPEPYLTVVASDSSVAEDAGQVVAFTFERVDADLAKAESVDFLVGGTADPTSLRADYSLAGHDLFDPATGVGSITIPAGESQAYLYCAILSDWQQEGDETCVLTITGSSSNLAISSTAFEATLKIVDPAISTTSFVESFDGFTSDPATWNGWTNAKNMNK